MKDEVGEMEVRHGEGLPVGVVLFNPQFIHPDGRGWFLRAYDEGLTTQPVGFGEGRWVQENQLRSRFATLRGFHFRSDANEAKLVRVVRGEIYDVVVDLRPWSDTFMQWGTCILDDRRHEQLFIPPGCAHAYQVLSQTSDVCLKTSTFYAPGLDRGFRWDDPEVGVPWPVAVPILSARDRVSPSLDEIRPQLQAWFSGPD